MAGKKQVNLLTNIIMGGKVTPGFEALAGRLQEVASAMSGINQQIIEFGTEAADTYRDYETNMLAAKGAMTANYASTSQLEREYALLDKKAQEWAGNTIFHTSDVSEAILEAARAGWTYEKMLDGIPAAMVLAQAGNLDLATGLDYLIKALNETGTEFGDSGKLVDQWAKAANSSATSIDEIGEAVLRMGPTARYADSTAELFTMLAILANNGVTGAQAGTLLRNSMIRLIAPTKKASDAMASLGLTEADFNEAVGADSEALEKANALLEEAGFTAYDSAGNLRPMLDIYKDLYRATSGMTEQDRNAILSAIFPTRSITGALALLEAAATDYDGLLGRVTDSEGYAQTVADIQMSGLMGSEELFKSKWEEFQRRVGETIASPLESAYGSMGGIIGYLNALPEEKLSALVGGLTGIAAASTGIGAAAGAMKLFAVLGPYGVGAIAVAGGIGALVGYLKTIRENEYEGTFGTMAVDMETVSGHLATIKGDLGTVLGDFERFGAAADKAVTDYQSAGQSLTETLWTKMVTGTTFDPEGPEAEAMQKYGEAMITAAIQGATNTRNADFELAGAVFGSGDVAADAGSNPLYATLLGLLEFGYDDALAQIEAKGQALRDALLSAFKDGTLTPEEMEGIQQIIEELNALMAEATNPADLSIARLMNKSMTVGIEGMREFSDAVAAERDSAFTETDEQFESMLAMVRVAYNKALAGGGKFFNTITGEYMDAKSMSIDEVIAQSQAAYAQQRTGWASEYDLMLARAWTNAISTSDAGELWKEASQAVQDYQNGMITFGNMAATFEARGGRESSSLFRALGEMLDYFGGDAAAWEAVGRYRGLGTAGGDAMATTLETVLDAYGMLGGGKLARTGSGPDRMWDAIGKAFEGDIGSNASYAEAYSTLLALPLDEKQAFSHVMSAYRKQYDIEGIGKTYGGIGLTGDNASLLGAYMLASGKLSGEGAAAAGFGVEAMVTYDLDSSAVDAYTPPDKNATVHYGVDMADLPAGAGGGFAEGGRATVASIFGEAGPEWAIPEEHSARTASLLDAARRASGFTWSELIGRAGGLGAGTGVTVQIGSYAPVIHASNADGVAAELIRDKLRLRRVVQNAVREALNENRLRDAVEVYA